MATYFTDFSTDTIGVQPTGFASRFVAPTSFTVESDVTATGGRVLRVVKSAAGRTALSWDTVPASGTVEVLMRAKTSVASGTTSFVGPFVRGSGAASTETGYAGLLAYHADSGKNLLVRYSAGVSSTLVEVNEALAASTFVWMRMSAVGGALKLRRWSGAVGDEPTTWDLETTDTTITSGWSGLLAFAAATYDIDLIGVGTGGDAAPSSATITPTLAAPTGLTAVAAGQARIDVSWSAVTGATGYDLEINGTPVDVGNVLTYADTGLAGGTARAYRVRAYDGAGDGAYSASVSATTALPAAPTRTRLVVQTRVGGAWV